MAVYRLDKWLVSLGIGSRRDVGKLIRSGRIIVDGETLKKPETKLTEGQTVLVDGEPLILEEHAYYMMNKPAGALSATRDKNAKTVIDLLPTELLRPNLFPAGRLDKDTEGFLLITNDGDFAHRILAPKNRVPKTYIAHLKGEVNEKELVASFDEGVNIGDGEKTTSAQLNFLETGETTVAELTIYEGMFHQVKRMFAEHGLAVVYLKRTAIGGLKLDKTLELGQVRKITQEELKLIVQ